MPNPSNPDFGFDNSFNTHPREPSQISASTMPTIQILEPAGKRHAYPVEFDTISVGSGEDNSIIIRDAAIAHYHLEIRFERDAVTVIDLNSAGGTYLGTDKIPSNQPVPWSPDQILRIGEYFLRLEGFNPPKDARDIPSSPQLDNSSAIAIFFDQEEWSVEPGRSRDVGVVIVNNSSQDDTFDLHLEGLAPDWYILPAPLFISSGEQKEVVLRFTVPEAPEGSAGTFPLQLMASGSSTRLESRRRGANLVVPSVVAFKSVLNPISASLGEEIELTVENFGNSSQVFDLQWHDVNDQLEFEPSQAQLEVPPGAAGISRVRADWKQRPLIGGSKTLPIKATVTATADPNERQINEGQIVGRSRFPWWLVALPFLCLICAAIPVLALGRIGIVEGIGEVLNAPVAILDGQVDRVPGRIEMAATENAAAYATAEAELTDEANLIFAATESWLDEDDDDDGLTNREEQNRGTLVETQDTDADGLSDGDEVNKWLTDPRRADSDGDGLSDGDEVARGIDPRSVDTDRDGTPDPNDSNPGRAPTPTPDATKTAVAIERATAQAGCVVNTGYDVLNLRLGPGYAYDPPLAELPGGTRLLPISYRDLGAAEGQWIEVLVRGTIYRGWVSLEWVQCNMQVVELPPGEVPPTPTQTVIPSAAATPNPEETSVGTSTPTVTSEFTVTPTDTGATLPPPGNSDDITTLEEIYGALQIVNVQPEPDATFSVGETVDLSFGLQNQSDKRLVVPVFNGSTLIGIRQVWVERLDDPEIPVFPPDTPRSGNKYRLLTQIIPATIVLPGDEVTNFITLDTTNYPPGDYQFTYEFLELDGQPVIDSAQVQITLVQ